MISSCCCYFYVEKFSEKIFDEIYLINLKRRPDRLKNFLKHYNDSDIGKYSLVKFDAIDGSKLDVESVPLSELAQAELQQLETIGFRNKHYQLTKGAIGCYLSHVKVWEHILKNNHSIALVFEDDAKVPSNFLKQTKKYIKNVPNNWDIILLGYLCNKCLEYKEYNKVERFMLTHCYLIKKETILKILKTNSLFPITQQIDSYMSELSSIINIYTIKNKYVKQFGSRTDIQAPIMNKNTKEAYERLKILNNNIENDK